MHHADPALLLLGVDFRRASTRWRSALALSEDERSALVGRLRDEVDPACGLAVLSTCSRSEWIVSVEHALDRSQALRGATSILLQTLRGRAGWNAAVCPEPYLLVGGAALRHLLRVSVGLASFVVGERQIGNQMRAALESARASGQADAQLRVLGSWLSHAIGRVHRETRLSRSGRGVHSLAVDSLLEQLPAGLPRPRILVVGMGQIGRKAAQVLTRRGYTPLLFNRTVPADSGWLPLAELPAALAAADGVLVASGAPFPIIDRDTLAAARPGLPVVDIGSPAQVDADDSIRLSSLDQLLAQDAARYAPRGQVEAEALVETLLNEFRQNLLHRRVRAALAQADEALAALLARTSPAERAALGQVLPRLGLSAGARAHLDAALTRSGVALRLAS